MVNPIARLQRWFLARALKRACESSVPRSGKEGADVNCFNALIDRNDGPFAVVLSIDKDQLKCLAWNGKRFEGDLTLSFAASRSEDWRITHYAGLVEVRYTGLADFVLGQIFRWPYLKIFAYKRISAIDKYFFNRRKLVTRQRIELLKLLLQQRFDGHNTFDEIDLMTNLYSVRWVEHPDQDAQRNKLAFYIDALVDSGEAEKINNTYQLTPKAMLAVEEYEEQERRHTENVKVQRKMLWLTLAIVFLTLVQSGLIRFPVILDMSKMFSK